MISIRIERKAYLLIALGLCVVIFAATIVSFGLPQGIPIVSDIQGQLSSDVSVDHDIEHFKPLAEKGDPQSQFSLALRYIRRGAAHPESYRSAFEWAEKASSKGHGGGLVTLGNLYLDGLGQERSSGASLLAFTLAADPSNPNPTTRADAACNLGQLYARGEGVPKDYQLALKYYGMAAQAERPFAELRLGIMYALGQGVPQNFGSAYQMIEKAARIGDANARNIFFAMQMAHLNETTAHPDANTIFMIELKIAEQGFEGAQLAVAERYFTGKGVAVNPTEGIKWIIAAAQKGDLDAQYAAGEVCEREQNLCGGPMLAYKWLSLAAAQNHPDALTHLENLKTHMTLQQIAAGEDQVLAYKLPTHN